MNSWRIVRAIALRDLRLLVANKITVIPMVVLPLVIFAGLPLLVGLVPAAMNLPVDDLDILVDAMPEREAAMLPADPDARLAVLLLAYLFAPMLLLVPLMLAVVAAAGSIAGERERRTLETLLLSPATDRQLFIAKTAGAWVPAVVITFVGTIAYQAVANHALADTGVRPFPNATWTLLIVWVSPALAAATLGVVVTISARSRTYEGALQAGGLLVLPLIAVLIAQATGLLFLGPMSVAVAGAALWALAGLLLPRGARAMRRDNLTARM
jgi:ABC-2 type transport system permease protein